MKESLEWYPSEYDELPQPKRIHSFICPICFATFAGEEGLAQHTIDSPECERKLVAKEEYIRRLDAPPKPKLVLTTKTINCNTFSEGCIEHPTFHFWNPARHEYVPFHCGSWRCPSCAPVKVENVTGDLVRSAYQNKLSKHLTLTLDPKKVVGDPWVYNQKTWHKMCVYLWRLSKRRHRRLKWQRVVQIQPGTGLPHNHIMLSEFIPVKWIMESWKAVGGGSAFIRYVKIDTIGGFVRGYFTKQVLGFDFPRRKRRYSTSRNIKLARAKEEGWKLLRYVSRSWIDESGVQKTGYYTEADRMDFVADLEKSPLGILTRNHLTLLPSLFQESGG